MYLRIAWIKIKSLIGLPIYPVDILLWTKHYYANEDYDGLCCAIYNSIRDLMHVYRPPQYFIPLFSPKVAKAFHKTHGVNISAVCCSYGCHWWKPRVWELNGGRLGFLHWLIEQYKGNKTNLRKI